MDRPATVFLQVRCPQCAQRFWAMPYNLLPPHARRAPVPLAGACAGVVGIPVG
jgi:hypothetical protein